MLRVPLATIAALLASAVPALAAPAVVEFERPAPPAPAAAAADRGYVVDPLRSERRFNLVGLSWRGDAEPAIALRARRAGGEWTRWTPASAPGGHAPEVRGRETGSRRTSEPVWVGAADWVQYRLSRRVPGLRLHFVRARAPRPEPRARSSVRRPRIRSRAEWGGQYCPTRGVAYGQVRAAVVHHTVTANQYTRAQAPSAILAVCRFHRNTNGWNDIGYNFVVDRYGRIWEGRDGGVDEAVMGSHAQGYNSQTTGISNLGTFTSVPQTDRAIQAMARLIRWKLGNHGVRTAGRPRLTSAGGSSARYPAGDRRRFERILGHRDTGVTSCPGEQLYYQLPELRERVGERAPRGDRSLLQTPIPELVGYTPDGYTFGGSLTDRDGVGIAGRAVELQRLRRTGWKRIGEAVTDSDGAFAAGTRFKRNTVVRWEFTGDELYRPARGDGVLVGVAPLITLEASDNHLLEDERVELSGTIYPRKSDGLRLVVERESQPDVWRRVARRKVAARRGTFTKRRRFAEEGRYRLAVEFGGDLRNAAGLSPYVEVTVTDPFSPF